MQALPQTLSCRRTHQAHGFTLVELLVALMLLSLIALGLGGAMRTISQTQERVDTRTERAERQQSAVRFLRSVMADVSGERRPSAQVRPGESRYYFVGQPQEMQWLGSMPAGFGGGGGRTMFRLALQPGAQGTQLVLQYRMWEKNATGQDWSNASSYVLDSDVQHFSLNYQRISREAGLQWLPLWDAKQMNDELPSAIGIRLVTADGAWPLTVLALRQPMAEAAASGGHAIGGSAR